MGQQYFHGVRGGECVGQAQGVRHHPIGIWHLFRKDGNAQRQMFVCTFITFSKANII
jgi:hypothetical protein